MKEFDLPDIKIFSLEIWIHGRQFPDSEDYWDSNWMVYSAKCTDIGSEVFVQNTYFHLNEIKVLLEKLEILYSELKGEIKFDFMEPELSLKFLVDKLGHISLEVNITPDQLNQNHTYSFAIDQSYLPKIINDLKSVLIKYPIKNVT